MPHCTKCGAMVADNAGFCPNCGAAQSGAGAVASSNAMTQTGMKENIAGLLCYILGWVTGLIFF
ncbi:MAG: zinc-ribbon domain-containing protein, partial [Candidatus Acidiferrales bacterium]